MSVKSMRILFLLAIAALLSGCSAHFSELHDNQSKIIFADSNPFK